jgi:hypothetical protein
MHPIIRLTALALVTAGIGSAGVAANEGRATSYSARIVNFDEPSGRTSQLVQFRVTRWSTEAERDQLTSTLLSGGQDGLLKALSKLPPVGVIRTPGTAGYPFRYARHMPGPNGDEQILIVIDRPLGFAEFRQGWQTVDYPFTVVEFQLNAEGTGEGQLLGATRISASSATGDIAFQQYASTPMRLQAVRRE